MPTSRRSPRLNPSPNHNTSSSTNTNDSPNNNQSSQQPTYRSVLNNDVVIHSNIPYATTFQNFMNVFPSPNLVLNSSLPSQ